MKKQTVHTELQASFPALMVAFQAILMLSTLPLWLGTADVPAVPLFAFADGIPFLVDRVLCGVFLLISVLYLVPSLRQRFQSLLMGVLLATSLLLILLNQHRLQPWNWLFLLAGTISLWHSRDRLSLYRVTFITVYVFAALSRIGPSAATGTSLKVVTTILSALSAEQVLRDDSFVFLLCLGLSLAELTCGLLLWNSRTRRAGVFLCVALHTTLILVLGPLGLGHHAAVLLWNAWFLLAVPLLFWSQRPTAAESHSDTEPTAPSGTTSWRFRAAVLILFLLPASGLFGIMDNWLSWQVYSPRPEVLRVFVKQQDADRLPVAVREFVMPPLPLQDWCAVRTDLWMLAATGAPTYPENRFQIAVAAWLMKSVPDGSLRVRVDAPEVPFWWQRHETELKDRAAVRHYAAQFFFNASAVRMP